MLSSGVCVANDPKESAADAHFKEMDPNGNGKLSPHEHAAGSRKMFDRMDADKDGFVSRIISGGDLTD